MVDDERARFEADRNIDRGVERARTVVSAAGVLAISERQTFRLLAQYQEQGGGGLVHKARGRASNRQINAGVRAHAVDLVRSKYADFGPTLATGLSGNPWLSCCLLFGQAHRLRVNKPDTKGGSGMTQFGRCWLNEH